MSLTKHVIYCNAEDDPVMQKYRLEAAGADMKNVTLDSYVVPDDIELLFFAIVNLNAGLVIFDTAAKHISGPIQRWDKPLARLAAMLARTECSALFVHHTLKGVKANADWRAAVGGSVGGLVGTSRALWLFGMAEDGRPTLCPVKDSYAETPDAIAFEFATKEFTQSNGDDIEIAHMQIVEKGVKISNPTELVVVVGKDKDGKKGPSPERRAEGNKFLAMVLKDGPVPVNDAQRCLANPDDEACGHSSIAHDVCPGCKGPVVPVPGLKYHAEQASISWGTLKRCFTDGGIESSRKGQGKGSIPFKRLPAGHPALNVNAPDTLI